MISYIASLSDFMGLFNYSYRIAAVIFCYLINVNFIFGANEITNFLKNTYNGFSKNWAIDFEDNGTAYFGNEAGLLQFDGNMWELYKTPGNGSVRSILVIGDRIYTGSFEEFGYWEKGNTGKLKYTSLSANVPLNKLHNDMIWKIVKGNRGEIIFQSFNTIYIYENDELSIEEIGGGIIFLLNVRNRLITQKTRGNLLEYDSREFKEIEGSDNLYRAFTRVLLPFEGDKFLLGTGKKGLFVWDGKNSIVEWKCEAQRIIKEFDINAGTFDGQFYYIGTLDNGIFKLSRKGEIIEHLNSNNGLESNTILDVKCDKQKRLWVALNKGISCIEFNRPVDYISDVSANWGVVHAVAIFQGNIYVGTDQGVYYHPLDGYDLSELKPSDFKVIEELKGHAWTLKQVGDYLLCGHNKGSFQIKGRKVTQISTLGGGQSFIPIQNEKKEFLIQNSYTSLVLFRKGEDGFELSNILKGFFEPSRNMEVDQYNNIWVSHTRRKEVFKVQINELNKPLLKERYGLNKGMPQNAGNKVSKLDGRIVFTTNSGLFTYDELRDTVVRYAKVEEQLNEYAFANAVVQSDFNKYWFALPQKVALFKVESNTIKKEFEYAFSDPYNSLDEKYPIIVALNDSTTAFGLENGLALVYKSAFEEQQNNFDAIHVRHVTCWNKNEISSLPNNSGDTIIRIPYTNKKLMFDYMSMASVAQKSKYWVKLEGFHDRWIKGNKRNRIVFEKLPWGSYTLHIKGEDEFGHELLPVKYSFLIERPFFAQIWFIILVSIIGLIAMAGIVMFVRKLIKEHHIKLVEDEKRAWEDKYNEEQHRNEERMIRLKNELLQKEIQHQSTELANRTIATIKRKEVLTEVKQEILKQREHLKYSYPEKYMNRLIRMIDHSIEDEDDWNVFRLHFDRAHEDFFKRLKNNYEDLTPKDLRLCAYLKMNLSTKEIAPLMNVSLRSVEVHRYKIRKKLHLDPNDNLSEFMISF